MTVFEGDTVVIECSVEGNPKPEVSWLRDWLNVSIEKTCRLCGAIYLTCQSFIFIIY